MDALGRFLFGLVETAVLGIVRAAFPSSENQSAPDYQTLRARNAWINGVAQVLFVAAFGVTLWRLPRMGLVALGIACGMAVAVPFVWVCLATLPFGLDRYREFWRFHQLHYEMGTMGAVALALPFAAAGAICAAILLML